MRRRSMASPAASNRTIGRAAFGLSCLCLLALMAIGVGAGTAAADGCSNALVRAQQGAQSLADCRAYEKVSPADKNNGEISLKAIFRSTPDGDGFEFEADAAFAGSEGASHSSQYLSWRSGTGWTTEAISPYQTPNPLQPTNITQGYFEFTRDLTKGVLFASHDPSDRSEDTASDQGRLYLRQRGVAGFNAVSPPIASPSLFSVPATYVGSSEDMSRIFFQSPEHLTQDAPPAGTEAAYEWHEGAVQVVGVLPNEEVAPDGAVIGQGNALFSAFNPSRRAISGDGTQVVFASGSPQQLYLRVNGKTKLLSASQKTSDAGAPAAHGATFMSSVEEGGKLSKVYFASPDLLTEDAEGNPTGAAANELYAYDLESEELTFLSVDSNHTDTPGARVYPGWLGTSADGSYLYFLTTSALVPGGKVGLGINLYLWHDGKIEALATPSFRPNDNFQSWNYGQVSRSGHQLLYVDTKPLAPGAPSGVPEIYLYDADVQEWTCVSCNPVGVTQKEGRINSRIVSTFAGIASGGYEVSNLSEDGSRVFFQTAEPLVSRDTNGRDDVYEWRDGAVHLISSGRWTTGADLLDATPDGSSVFIATREPLVGADRDEANDVYAVREGGGFLETAPPVACGGDTCQQTPAGPRSWSAPSSAGLSGTGNVGQRRKRARCAPPRRRTGAARARGGKAKSRCARKHRGKAGKRHAARKRHARGKAGKRHPKGTANKGARR